jgi:trans-aconitate methyltransferase
MSDEPSSHWENVYATKDAAQVSWFEETPALSLELISAAYPGHGGVIDFGGGASRLAGALVEARYAPVAVLDLSASALAVAKARLGAASNSVEWIVADVTQWRSTTRYDVWHDRAAFHFLTDPVQQQAYVEAMRSALASHGIAIIGTFAPDGAERCSGLTVARHDAASIAAIIGQDFELANEERHEHLTPGGSVQQFQFSTFRRVG